ncbi:hypothetical protein [Streptomyces sp. Qhu_M48]|uniref:hypothetical protein n=1 Tax=Streptomyces sp. Qhu_M48 TaxID=3435889 RepID=UPI003F4F6200
MRGHRAQAHRKWITLATLLIVALVFVPWNHSTGRVTTAAKRAASSPPGEGV